MDRRERTDDFEELFRSALDGWQRDIWTALPGIIESFDPSDGTATVQPSILGKQSFPDGASTDIQMPLLIKCPVLFPGGGGFTLTFPVTAGDECLVVFASRCIDAWWQSSGVQPQMEYRLHDISDGFVLLSPRSVPRALPDISTTHAQLRSDDGQTYIEVQPGGKVRINAVDIEYHASHSYSWDVGGYGQRITSLGGGSYQVLNWQTGAVVATVNSPIHPPEGP